MEKNGKVWISGGLLIAHNAILKGLNPVRIGLGERDFYIDIEATSGLTLEEAKELAKYTEFDYLPLGGKAIVDNKEIEIEGFTLTEKLSPKIVDVLNVSVHRPSPERHYLRVRAVAFLNEEERENYMKWLESALEVDHRALGERLDLFSFHDEVGPGLVLYHPKGVIIRNSLMQYMREINYSMGYEEVYTSHVFRSDIWKISGHYSNYRDKMLIFKQDDEEIGVKPMNCPGHIMIYTSRTRSYRELPIRFFEFGHVYRWEQKGELYGLLRIRGFVQDDGHIFLRPDQIEGEIGTLLTKTFEVLNKLGFSGEDVRVFLSTRPDISIGTEEQWEVATSALRKALETNRIKFEIKEKEGAFYGPKIDFEIRDSLNRWWQLSTIQVDFNLPERFKIEYVDSDNTKKRPVMIHRAIYGSYERILAILLEHYRGKLPTWLSPTQVVIMPISQDQMGYSMEIANRLRGRGIRVEVDISEEKLAKRVKKAYDEGVPYIIVIGKKEQEKGKLTVRGRGNKEVRMIDQEKFEEVLTREIRERSREQYLFTIEN